MIINKRLANLTVNKPTVWEADCEFYHSLWVSWDKNRKLFPYWSIVATVWLFELKPVCWSICRLFVEVAARHFKASDTAVFKERFMRFLPLKKIVWFKILADVGLAAKTKHICLSEISFAENFLSWIRFSLFDTPHSEKDKFDYGSS